MKKTIKIEVPKGATPKMVPIGDDGWAVEFEDAKPEIEIGSWWVHIDNSKKIYMVTKTNGCRVYYDQDSLGEWSNMHNHTLLSIPPKPDKDELKKKGYELTGEAREPKEGEIFVTGNGWNVWSLADGIFPDAKYGRRRWIVRKITLKGLDLLKTLIPGDYVAINGVGILVTEVHNKIHLIPYNNEYNWMNPNNEVGTHDFERAIGMKVSDITESHIEWRWKAPR